MSLHPWKTGVPGEASSEMLNSRAFNAAYTDNGTWTDSSFAYPASVWLPVSLVLHPAAGTYDVYVNGTELATAHLTSGAGAPAQIRLLLPVDSAGASFVADDLMVQPLAC